LTASSVSPTVGRENNINIILPTASEVLGGRGVAVRIIERVAEHYDVQEVEFGKVYIWCVEEVVVECECGTRSIFERSELIASEASCGECGKGIRSDIREEVQDKVIGDLFEDDERVHPWRYWHTTKDTGIPF
jgi:hypothetical protein